MSLEEIDDRDAALPVELPGHWTAQLDRRELLNRIDELEEANAMWLAKWDRMECEWCGWNQGMAP